ncbi:endonuclease domain-containing protein [Sphingomonas sp.]|jgi:very-short-patch-repair endonuclease|uniref:endonuclease domain-containing protein n=1 Tax=Sphingomonas sp. TaxID=28214 RepID=UPI002ED84A4B
MRDQLLIGRAKAMRKEATDAEVRIWLALKARRFADVKFRRQKVVGPYIVDFAARSPMLVVEVDGDTHADRGEYDHRRTRYLENQGYRVIRFTNSEVMTNFDGVLMELEHTIRTPPLPTLSPEGERAF